MTNPKNPHPELLEDCSRPKTFELSKPAIITRRQALFGLGMIAGSSIIAPASATGIFSSSSSDDPISPLMCKPKLGHFGGNTSAATSATADSGSALVDDVDYSSAVPDDGPGVRFLKMVNPHNGETFAGNFVEGGSYNQSVLKQFTHFARDWRQNEELSFSPATIEIIWKIWRKLNMTEPFRLNSGYRSPKTNASLKGAATQSLHMKALAADLSCNSRTPAQVHKVAVSLKAGGVGRYATFTHVDCGRVRYWG